MSEMWQSSKGGVIERGHVLNDPYQLKVLRALNTPLHPLAPPCTRVQQPLTPPHTHLHTHLHPHCYPLLPLAPCAPPVPPLCTPLHPPHHP